MVSDRTLTATRDPALRYKGTAVLSHSCVVLLFSFSKLCFQNV